MAVTGLHKADLAMNIQTALLRKQLDNQASNILKLIDSVTGKDGAETSGPKGAKLDIFA